MDKVRRDKRKEVHVRLDFGEGSIERRTREYSHHSSARARTKRPERLKVQDRLRYGDRHVLDRLGHRRQSAFDRLSETYSPSTTKSRPGRTNSKDYPRGRSRPRRLDTSNEDCPEDRERFRGVGESYDDSYSHSYHDRDRSRHMKRRRDNESSLSSVSKSDSSDGRYQKSRSKRHKPTDEDDLTRPWMCEEEDLFTPRIRDTEHSTRAWMNFMIVRSLSPYNGIIRRPGIREIQAVPSIAHGMLKFPVDEGIVTIRSTNLIPAECTMVITSSDVPKEVGARLEIFKVALHPNFPDQEVAIGGTLSAKGCTELCSILKKNLDIFAWKPSDMTGVPYPYKCFLDAYKGYHQIQLAEPNEEKTAFHTGQGVYCYTKMPFGLKNAGATYQRLVDKAFDSQIGRNIEVYVDDLVVKCHTEAEMLRDIDETFRMLRKINMKLNHKKCTFGAVEGVLLGYGVTPKEIKPCPDKTAVIPQLPSPRTIKEVRSLNEKLASLNRFLSKSAEKSLPLFKTLKKCIKKSDFHWTAEVEQAFKQLKQHLSELPLLVAPKPKEELIVLADFLTKMPNEHPPAAPVAETQQEPWTLFTDGSSCVDGSGVRLILTSPEGIEFTYVLRFQFAASNNEAEYKALIAGLRITTQMGVQNVHAEYVIREIHEGSCSMHARPRSVVAKATRLGYYWPTMQQDARDMIPGPLSEGPGKVKFLIVAMDYFTKWIEAKAVATITGSHVKKFVWDNIVCRFGLPGEIVSDNGKQFSENPFKDWCDKLNITQRFASVKYPQSNGLVKRANGSLGEGIKACLGKGNTNWVEELPHVLWAHRTMIKSSHGYTPFSLTYETEAVIPAKIRMPTYRTAAVDVSCCGRREAGPKWEGPYEVTEALGDGAYKLWSTDETVLPRT
nr:reverse transcriptase domain-containing protein [Tanacetum cinerariifolium]